jgi:hypothetical protein
MCQGERGDEALVFKSTLFSLVTLHSQCTTEREDEVLMVKYSFLVTFPVKVLFSSDLSSESTLF